MLFRILRALTSCRKSSPNLSIDEAIKSSLLEERELSEDTRNNPVDAHADSSSDVQHRVQIGKHAGNIPKLDLTKSIQSIISIFGHSNRISGEETEPFHHQLQPILDQMEASQILDDFEVTVLFSVLTGKARLAASKIRTHNIKIDEFIHSLSNLLLFEHNIQGRKINRWNAISYSNFRAKKQHPPRSHLHLHRLRSRTPSRLTTVHVGTRIGSEPSMRHL